MLNPKPILGYLVIKNHPILKDKLPIYEGENIIGRVPDKSNLIIKDGQISSAHAKIKITHDKILLTDIGSKNGTFVSLDTKQRLQKGVSTEIKEGESFALGEVQCAVEIIVQSKKSSVTPQKSKQPQQNKPGVLFQLQQDSQAYKKVKNHKTGDEESNRSENLFGEKYRKNKEEQKFIRIKKDSVKLRQSQDLELQQSQSLEIPKKKQFVDQPQKNAKQMKKKATKQKQDKQKQLKEKKQKQEKERIQMEKRQKQKLSKKSAEELKKKEQEEKLKRQRERQQRKRIAEEQSRDESQRQREELQAKKKEKIKKQSQDKKNKVKSKQQEQKKLSKEKPQSLQSKDTKKQSKEKQKQQKQDKKDDKKDSKEKKIMKKGVNKVLQVSKESSDSRNKDKKKSTSRETKDKQQKNLITKTRKRAPLVNKEDGSSDERKPYRTRQRIIKVTKFMVSGQPISFKLSPMLQMVYDIDEDFDVLVMDTFIRTFKLLFSIVRGIPIVKKSWLVDSQYFKKSMDFDNYWLVHPQDKYLIKESVQKAQTGFKVLNDMKFYVACQDEKLHMPFEQLERLIYAAGGEVIRSFKSIKGSKALSKEVIVLLDKNYNNEEISTAKEINKDNIYLVELVLQGCLTQELDLEAYKVKV